MAPKMFQTQHKPQRDEQRSKELVDIKHENHALKKQVQRLRRQISKMVERHGLEAPDLDEPMTGETEIPVPVVELEKNVNRCDRCGAEAKEISVGGKFFLACLSKCGWKKKIG